MKILLIYPSVSVWGQGRVAPHWPMGLMYLSGFLKREGHDVKILDALAEGRGRAIKVGKYTRVGLADAQIKKAIIDFGPDMVGISIMFSAFEKDGLRMARIAKSVDRKIVTVVGGAHVSIDPRAVVKNEEIDVAVWGEGELTISELAGRDKSKKEWKNICGLAFKSGRGVVVTPRRELVRNLDELTFPDWEGLRLDLYYGVNSIFQMRQPMGSVVTSRGCPNHCVYCSIHSLWEHSWRGRSATNVVDEIELLATKYGIREISFQDDSMSVNKKRMAEICQLLIDRKLDVKWTTPNGIAHWTLDKNLIKLMKRAGCYRITFGIESGNPEMRRWVGKPFSLKEAKDLTKYANKIGMWTLATNIIGFPYETQSEIEDTINYAIDSDVDLALFFRLGPRKGTPVYEIFKKEGWLPPDQELYSEEVSCQTKYFAKGELISVQKTAYNKFLRKRLVSLLNPIRIGRKIRSWEDLKYVFKIGRAGLGMVRRLAGSNLGITSKTFRV